MERFQLGHDYQCKSESNPGYFGALICCVGITVTVIEGVLHMPLSPALRNIVFVSFKLEELEYIGKAAARPMANHIGARELRCAA